jgi:hypothetical protein
MITLLVFEKLKGVEVVCISKTERIKEKYDKMKKRSHSLLKEKERYERHCFIMEQASGKFCFWMPVNMLLTMVSGYKYKI